ncbi:MAG: hypothetical protein H7Y02_05235 [Candidatus Obscuribacterales bacterium]|nr:hypothetical protein [Steroidobacteraceae bacterium]
MTNVVSERARSGLDHFLAQATKNALVATGESCPVTPIDDASATEREVVMFTVSSYTFRILLFIHFESNAATRAHFGRLADKSVDEMAGERFLDAMMERGNLLCGALNRELALFFPHIGMSTPCILHRSAVEHIGAVTPAFTRRYRAQVSADLALRLTIAVCAFADLDFPFDHRAVDETKAASELEIF